MNSTLLCVRPITFSKNVDTLITVYKSMISINPNKHKTCTRHQL